MTLAQRARKFAKPEMRAAVDEWEKQLQELHTGGADNEGAATRYTLLNCTALHQH
jgi:hypothetical protein